MYKLVVLDVDGTLITPNRRLTLYTKKIIRQVANTGVHVAICTGRNLRLTRPVVKKLGIKPLYACVGGTVIFNKDNTLLYHNYLSIEDIGQLLDVIRKYDTFLQLTFDHGYYKHVKTKNARAYEIYGNNSITSKLKHLYIGMKEVNHIDDYYDNKYNNANEIVLGGPDEVLLTIKEEIESKFGDTYQARNDLWGNYLFITKNKISKAETIKRLCEYYNISREHVIAIGDEINDLDMIKIAGLGIAMGNAVEEVKKHANDITYANNKNGAAYALKHYIIDKNFSKINYTE